MMRLGADGELDTTGGAGCAFESGAFVTHVNVVADVICRVFERKHDAG